MNIGPINAGTPFKGGKIVLRAVKLEKQPAENIQPDYAVNNTRTHIIDVNDITGAEGYKDRLKYIYTQDNCYYLGTNNTDKLMDKFTYAYKTLMSSCNNNATIDIDSR